MLTDAPEQTTPAPAMPPTDKPNLHEKDAKTLLVEMLAGYGEASALLEQAIMPVLEGKTTLGEVLCLMKGQAVILYPDGARSLGAPSEVLSKLSHANAIVPDPIMPGRKVRDFSGVKAIVLAEQLSDAVVAAIKDAEASMGDTRMPLSSSLPWLDASKNKSAPKQQSRKKAQQQKPEVNAGKPSPEQKAKGKDSQPQQKEKKVDVTSPVEEPQRQPVQENRTWLAFLSGRFNQWLLSPKLSVRRNWDTSRCEKGKSQRLGV